jgi:Protein of unknown function (DUF2934)
MEHGSGGNVEVESSVAGDAAFEQLLRFAVSYARRKTTAGQGALAADLRNPVTDIELRAYQLYLGRGASHGHDLDDWLQAERQVLEALKKEKTSLRVALAFGLLNAAR